jgi:hypothetical protein
VSEYADRSYASSHAYSSTREREREREPVKELTPAQVAESQRKRCLDAEQSLQALQARVLAAAGHSGLEMRNAVKAWDLQHAKAAAKTADGKQDQSLHQSIVHIEALLAWQAPTTLSEAATETRRLDCEGALMAGLALMNAPGKDMHSIMSESDLAVRNVFRVMSTKDMTNFLAREIDAAAGDELIALFKRFSKERQTNLTALLKNKDRQRAVQGKRGDLGSWPRSCQATGSGIEGE